MFNLLPQKEQRAVKTEYSLRRFTIILFLLCALAIISIVLLFPSYLLSRVRESDISSRLENAKQVINKNYPKEDLPAGLILTKSKIQALNVSPKNVSVYDLFRIFEDKTAAIKVTELSFIHRTKEEAKIALKGRAMSRESLTEFEKKLRGRPDFVSIDLPISNFAKETNIDFSMNIVVKI